MSSSGVQTYYGGGGQDYSKTNQFNKSYSGFNRTVSMQPNKLQAKMADTFYKQQSNSQQQQAAQQPIQNFRLNGSPIGRRDSPQKAAEIPRKPDLLVNKNSPYAVDQLTSKQQSLPSPYQAQKSADLYNRYLKMTLPNNYQDPKIAVHNIRGSTTSSTVRQTGLQNPGSASKQVGRGYQYPPVVRNASQRPAVYY